MTAKSSPRVGFSNEQQAWSGRQKRQQEPLLVPAGISTVLGSALDATFSDPLGGAFRCRATPKWVALILKRCVFGNGQPGNETFIEAGR